MLKFGMCEKGNILPTSNRQNERIDWMCGIYSFDLLAFWFASKWYHFTRTERVNKKNNTLCTLEKSVCIVQRGLVFVVLVTNFGPNQAVRKMCFCSANREREEEWITFRSYICLSWVQLFLNWKPEITSSIPIANIRSLLWFVLKCFPMYSPSLFPSLSHSFFHSRCLRIHFGMRKVGIFCFCVCSHISLDVYIRWWI